MNCPRCHHHVTAGDNGACKQCGRELNGKVPLNSNAAIGDYNRSPIKRGVRQGLLIIVFVFLLAALINVFTTDFHLPKYAGDVIAVLGLLAGIGRIIFAIARRNNYEN
jgi:uncharacterized membrane protein YvbJ